MSLTAGPTAGINLMNRTWWRPLLSSCRFPLREEVADNIEQPHPVPMVFLPNNGSGLAVPEDSNAGSGALSSSAAMGLLEKELVSAGVWMHLRRARRSRLTESIWRHLHGPKGTSYNVKEVEKTRKYVATHNNADKREKWSRVECEVNIIEEVMDIHLEEILVKHILKRLIRDARDILPQHLVHDQKDHSMNLFFTYRSSMLYQKIMEVEWMGDASAELFEHTFAGLEALLVSGAPLAEKRDGFGFEDCMAGLGSGRLPGNGEVAFVGGDGPDQCNSVALC